MIAMMSRILLPVIAAWAGIASAATPVPSLKPEAPASPFIARDEALTLRSVFEALDDRQYDAARALASDLSDPLAAKIARWALLHSNAPDNTLSEYDAFLDANPSWPNPLTLQRKAEATIDEGTPPQVMAAFFDTRDPITGFGKLRFGEAMLKLGYDELGAEWVRKAWIQHNFKSADSHDIVARHGRILREEDHFAKADRALFNRTTAGTEDVRGLLSEVREAEVTARRELLRGRTVGRELFNRLPSESQRDPGVLHAMTRYLRRKEREVEAIEMVSYAPLEGAAMRDAEAWNYEKKLLARWALKNGRFEDAYRLSAYSGLTEGSAFADAEFFAGWVALRFLNDPKSAQAHFAFLTEKVSSPISLARGNYWQARSHAAMGDEIRARAHYLVAADYPYTYYGQLAIETLGQGAPVFAFPEAVEADTKGRARLMERELARALRILDHVDQQLTYRRFAMALDDQLADEGEVRAFASLVRDAGEFDLVVRGGKATRKAGATVPEVIYPLYPLPESATNFAEAPLILGLSRQESEFRVNAYSSARAKGLMQMIDSTAKITARKERLPYEPHRLLTDPDYNLTLGAAHLSHLLERFGGSYIMVLAAYNAGPHRVDGWIEDYGDPRHPDTDPVDWVELIPFSETRNYVMRVLENVQVYRARIDGLPLGIQLTEDLTRGSPAGFSQIGLPVPVPRLWNTADIAGAPIIEEASLPQPPLAVLHAEGHGAGGFTPLLSPSDRQSPASNR